MSQSTVDSLLQGVQSLPPGDLDLFEDRLADWKKTVLTDEQLIETTRRSLEPEDDARLRSLVEKSEAGELTKPDRQVYLQLATLAEQVSVERVRALAELVRRWHKPMTAVMEQIGWDGNRHGA